MRLIVFAHAGEAVAFRKKGLLKTDTLIITGEGIDAVFKSLNSEFSRGGLWPSEIINFGIAGSLNSSVAPAGATFAVKEALLDQPELPLPAGFQNTSPLICSYPAPPKIPLLNCISARARVEEQGEANRLSSLAPVVDRELWAIGSFCALRGMRFRGYKVISDLAGKNTDLRRIKDQAAAFSDSLYEIYQSLSG